MTTLSEFTDTDDTTDIFLTNIEYTEVGGRPLIHLFGRDSDDNHHHQQVYGHNPHLSVPREEYTDRIGNHYAVRNVSEGRETLDGRDTVRIDTKLPSHVTELREMFDEPLEADVLYESRFLIDTDITTGVSIPSDTDRCHVDDISSCEPPDVAPRVLTVDIEVAADDGFPDAEDAEWPVISIVSHTGDYSSRVDDPSTTSRSNDNYSDDYTGWLLCTDECQWDATDGINVDALDDIRVYTDEVTLLDDFNQYVGDVQPDILTGWFSNDFDYPYLLNRCRNLSVWSYQLWSPLENAYTSTYGPVVDGVSCVDMLGVYEKTQIHNLKDKSLDAIANKELDVGKIDIGDDYKETWLTDPETLLEYNHLDVELVTRIDEAVGGIELFTNLRNITGVSYEDPVGGNFEIMDITFLRHARDRDIALPTAESPDVSDYHGAYVYTPEAGLHEHNVYPDYSSLYPNMMYQCNISPDTLVGTAEDLQSSEYTEDDCVWSYVDTKTAPDDKPDIEASEDRMEKVYFLKPSIKEGFVRKVLGDVMGLADEYSGKMYEAVKRVRNSSYGYVGDSDSYGDGSRLYDWRLAEAITLGGQRVLKGGAEHYADVCEDPDARVVYGDTDSCVTVMPNADDGEQALQWGFDAADDVNVWIDTFCVDEFGLKSEDDSRMEIEVETYASKLFFKGKDKGRSSAGVKKRYAQAIEWDDDIGWYDEPETDITGFDFVRSDVATVTQELQQRLLHLLLSEPTGEAIDTFSDELRATINDIENGEYPIEKLGKSAGISQSLAEYGSVDRKAQPQYRGAKYANRVIYETDAIDEGDRPLWFYVERVRGLPRTYDTETAEDGCYVDSVAVLDASDLPSGITIDTEKMIRKTLAKPLAPILRTLGYEFDELRADTDQSDISTFM